MRIRVILGFAIMLCAGWAKAQEKYGALAIIGPEETKKVVRDTTKAVLYVVSQAPDLIFESNVQNLEARQISPSEWLLDLIPGRHIITIRSKGYLPVKTEPVFFQAKRLYDLRVNELKPIPGMLSIKSVPDSARLRINGLIINTLTPYRDDEAAPGVYNVQVIKDRYRTVEKSLLVESNKLTEWAAELTLRVASVTIEIKNDPGEVGIVLDGNAMGVAPGPIDVEPGKHQLLLQKVGYKYEEKTIEIPQGQKEIRLSEELEKIKTPFYKKWWFLTSSAAALAGGAAVLLGNDKPVADKPLPEAPDFPTR